MYILTVKIHILKPTSLGLTVTEKLNNSDRFWSWWRKILISNRLIQKLGIQIKKEMGYIGMGMLIQVVNIVQEVQQEQFINSRASCINKRTSFEVNGILILIF